MMRVRLSHRHKARILIGEGQKGGGPTKSADTSRSKSGSSISSRRRASRASSWAWKAISYDACDARMAVARAPAAQRTHPHWRAEGSAHVRRRNEMEEGLIEEFVADRAGMDGGPLPSAAQNITLTNTRSAR